MKIKSKLYVEGENSSVSAHTAQSVPVLLAEMKMNGRVR